jgi:molybdate transport system regulatory protein
VGKQNSLRIGARLKVVLGPLRALGPGKADLLEGIVATGSIAAAGKRLRMSYRRAWLLVDELNAMFKDQYAAGDRARHCQGPSRAPQGSRRP